MFGWLDRLFGLTDQMKPERAKNLARLAIISFSIALAWLAGAAPLTKGALAWVPAIALATIGFASLGLAGVGTVTSTRINVDKTRRDVHKLTHQLPQPTLPGYHLGCRVGRHRLECGLLQVKATTTTLPEAEAVRTHSPTLADSGSGGFQYATLYQEIGAALHKEIEKAAGESLHVASIGVALPGGVIPERGQFAGNVNGVPIAAHDDVSWKIAKELVSRCGMDTVRRVFLVEDLESIAKIIHLDNDARCAARWLITDRGPTWKDFICVFAGTGVGSGLVFDRHIFYGAAFRAGEVGHVNLNTGATLILDGGMTLRPRLCSCQRTGYHFESLVGIGGLGHLADTLDHSKLDALRTAYLATPGRAAAVAGMSHSEASGVILLRVLHNTEDPDLRAISEDFDSFLTGLMQVYGELFGVGITAVLSSLDLPHVALCGTIPEYLADRQDFYAAFNGYLAGHVMGWFARPEFGHMRRWGWRGAALLPRDPDYLKRRFP